jgi:outer membrane protein assembly factor BamB
LKGALAGILIVAASVGTALGALGAPPLVKLPAPPWHRSGPAGAGTSIRLVLVSSRRNTVTNRRGWFSRNHLDFAADRVPGDFEPDTPLHPLPVGTPTSYRGARLVAAVRRPGRLLLVYGRDFDSGRYLVARASGRSLYAYDFVNWAYAPVVARGDRPYVRQSPAWAAEVAGVLLVETTHLTYARSSGGLNGYVSALDAATGKLRWRSRPLVANARNFALAGDAIVTGYGFTNEPDFLYVLDRTTGTVVQRLPLPSSPEFVVRKGGQVCVRTYDHDLVFKIRGA